jgi:peptidoglycan/xylan/chitin deacetylase (PgdA/CDA1 family)
MRMHETIKQDDELWEIFTRKEEYHPCKLDNHQRFNYVSSRYREIREPKVSKYLIEKGFIFEYPSRKKFAVCLTHDVDDIYPPMLHKFLSTLHYMKKYNFDALYKYFKLNKNGCSPYRNFKDIINLEKKYGAKSSFYFMSTNRDFKRFRYDIESLTNELRSIIDLGWEVGLHGGYFSYDNIEEIKKEKAILERIIGKEIIGNRNHYLRFKVPDSWDLLSKAGFKYDTTLGYNDAIGFRNGMCHPFVPFNLDNDRSIDILEIPLNVMDTTFYDLRFNAERWFENIKGLITLTEKNSGVLTLLWHNSTLGCPFRDSVARLYETLLRYLNKRDAWITSAEEVYWNWMHELKR